MRGRAGRRYGTGPLWRIRLRWWWWEALTKLTNPACRVARVVDRLATRAFLATFHRRLDAETDRIVWHRRREPDWRGD